MASTPSSAARRCLALSLITAISLLGCATPPEESASSSPEEVAAYFKAHCKRVLTFVGYSGAGYQDETLLLKSAKAVLQAHDPNTTIVNIGATTDGIGAVYSAAKAMGFSTTGIVSILAKEYDATISPDVDRVFLIADTTWGGRLEETGALSPTSQTIVDCSDEFVGIGGGAVGRDELLAARKRGKAVRFIPADMNHQRAIEKAKKKGKPVPTDFAGAAAAALRAQ